MERPLGMLPGENVVLTLTDDLVLTNRRVRYKAAGLGHENLVSVTLDSVASCALVARSYPLLLLLAAVCAFVGFMQTAERMAIPFAVTALLLGAYFATRRTVLSVASNGGASISLPTSGKSRDEVIDFLEAVERAKLQMMSRADHATADIPWAGRAKSHGLES